MQDTQLYQQLLGLSGIWKVTKVDLKIKERTVQVRVECQESVWACPICSKRMHIRSYEERCWRHLDSCQFQTLLICPTPRVHCDEHGSQMVQVKQVAKTFKRHLGNILTYFDHRLTNAALEGLNSKIQGLIKKACGYRNRERFKNYIMFHCGGLNLYPEAQ